MASITLTLAALATSAVPDLQVVGVSPHHTGGSQLYTSARLHTEGTDAIIRVPRTPQAEVQLSSELLGLAALSDGAREQLPVVVPTTLGVTRSGDTRAVVSSFVTGDLVQAEDIAPDALLVESLSSTLAAIHDLPVIIAQRNGLPVRSAEDVRISMTRLVERAAATNFVPETVLQSWHNLLDTEDIWNFETCVIHGSLNAEQLRVHEDTVVGVLGWDALSIGDPAEDFTWLLAAGQDTCQSVSLHYALHRGLAESPKLFARAKMYHQLEVAKWLLHGVETHDQSIIDDAVNMFDLLVDRLDHRSTPLTPRTPLNEAQVALMLEDTPAELHDSRSETAEYESLDEDRIFELDSDFHGGEPLTAEAVDESPLDGDQQSSESDLFGGRQPE